MSDLFDKSIRTLELPRVLELLSEQAVSAEARQRALRLRPETEVEEVLRLLDQTDAARNLIGLRGSPSFSGVKPVAEALDRADRGGALNTRELLTIADLLTAARRAKEYFNDEAAEKTAIDHLFLSLHGNRFLEEKIKRAIPDEDTIADAASTELADIRRHMRAAQAKSRQILQKIISSPSYGKILQETIITQRDGRFVVPVKAEHKGDLPGLVHDISSTGATLFVEPMGVVQANNEYIELQAKEQKEIDRILAEFSAEAAAHREDIQWDYDTLVHLDLIFARGQLSYKMNAVRPEVRRDGAIHLRKARHPLLDPKTAVPIDIELGDTFDTLVITGPNTGGKTVTLKTLGLLTLMTQCGLHIPAADRSAVSVYERVLADIGDEQSIEQSLSTFSAHMVNIVEILKEADRHSLVLFDELEKAHDDLLNILLQVMEDGVLTDGLGRKVDFRNTVLVMTSNIGARKLVHRGPAMGFAGDSGGGRVEKDILAELKKRFKPEFLNRLDEVILFDRLSQPETEDIAGRLLTAVAGRLGALGVGLSAPREAVALLARESFDGDNGARPLRRAIRSQVEEPAAELLLSHELNQGDTLCLAVEEEKLVLRPEKRQV